MTEKTLHEAVHEHLEYLKGHGKSERTLYTYSKDLEQVEAFFGPDKKVSAILIPHVSGQRSRATSPSSHSPKTHPWAAASRQHRR